MPLIMCPDCRSSIPDTESFCPVCGRRMEAVRPVRRPAPLPETETEFGTYVRAPAEPLGPVKVRRGPIDWKGRMGCLVVLLIFALVIAAGSYLNKLVTPRYTPEAEDAYKFAVMGIKSRLKARTNVRFPSVSQIETGKVDSNTFRFRGNYYLKPDSGQGEAKEKSFTVVVKYTGSGEFNLFEWEILDLKY